MRFAENKIILSTMCDVYEVNATLGI